VKKVYVVFVFNFSLMEVLLRTFYMLFGLFIASISFAGPDKCESDAQKKYEECMEIAKEAKEGEDGITTSKHSKEDANRLENGGCKKMLEGDLSHCNKKH
jgi:hypothetical protein